MFVEEAPLSYLSPAAGGCLDSSASSVQFGHDSSGTVLPAHSFGALVVHPCAVVPTQLSEPLVVHHSSVETLVVAQQELPLAACDISPLSTAVPAHSASGALDVHSTFTSSLAVPAHSHLGALVAHSVSD